jgi:hypothetical protein
MAFAVIGLIIGIIAQLATASPTWHAAATFIWVTALGLWFVGAWRWRKARKG